MGEYKKKLLNEIMATPLKVGDIVLVAPQMFWVHARSQIKIKAVVKEIGNDGTLLVEGNENSEYKGYIAYVEKSQYERFIDDIGYNPFPNARWDRKLTVFNVDVMGLMLSLGFSLYGDSDEDKITEVIDGVFVPETTANPYVVDENGNKKYYQRDYCWNENDEQMLIQSIYLGLDCGKILLRNRGWDYVETMAKRGEVEDLAFTDIVDGKQRLHTLKRFMNDEFPDTNGRYYSDLSNNARRQFENSTPFVVLRLNERATDKETMECFKMINFAGKPMSNEYREFVCGTTPNNN